MNNDLTREELEDITNIAGAYNVFQKYKNAPPDYNKRKRNIDIILSGGWRYRHLSDGAKTKTVPKGRAMAVAESVYNRSIEKVNKIRPFNDLERGVLNLLGEINEKRPNGNRGFNETKHFYQSTNHIDDEEITDLIDVSTEQVLGHNLFTSDDVEEILANTKVPNGNTDEEYDDNGQYDLFNE